LKKIFLPIYCGKNAISRAEAYPSKTLLPFGQSLLVDQGETGKALPVYPFRLNTHLLFVPPAHIKPQNSILSKFISLFTRQHDATSKNSFHFKI